MRNDIPSDSASNFGARVRETLMTYLGKQGDPLDRGVTLRDLVDSGFASVSNFQFGGGSAPLITGPSVSGPYVPDLTAPPTPTGFTATAAITTIIIECDAPIYTQGHGHRTSHIYGAKRAGSEPQPVFANAVEITQFAGQVTSYATDPATEWHLWIKWESNDGVLSASPAGGTNGFVVTTGQDVAKLLEALTGELTSAQLFSGLSSRIDLIDAPASLAGSVNARVNAVQAQVNDLQSTPAYSSSTTYAVNALVSYNGAIYQAIQATTGNLPTNTTYWTKVGDYTSLGQVVAAHTTQIGNIVTDLGAETVARQTLYNQVNDATTGLPATVASLTNNYYTKTATDSAITSATTSLVSGTALNNALGAYTTTANLINDYYTKSATDSAITSATQFLVSNTALDSALATYASSADLTNNYYTKTATDSAISQATLDLVTSTNLNNTLGNYATTATLSNDYYTKTATDSAISVATTGLVSETALNNTLGSYTSTATLTNDYYTKTATDSAISNATLYLVSETGLNSALGNYATTATLSSDYYTKTATDSAITNATTTFVSSSTLDNYTTTAALQANYFTKSSGENLEGRYTVKVDLNGYVSGFGLASTANTAGATSTFAVRADSFYIASPSGPGITPTMPFIVRTAETEIGGQTVPAGVYITDGYIQNGTITNAKIADLAVDSAKITSLTADKIIAGSISVGQYIQSSNFVAGNAGWRVDGNGVAEFGAAAIRGQLVASQIDTRGLSIKDSNGNIIFAAGTPLSTTNITGLGSLATANTVAATSVTGLGSLATADTVAASSVTGLGSLATANTVAASSVTGLGTLATASSVNWSTQITNIPSFGNFAFLSSITSANISTYIASAAIGEAYIADASITNAKIGTAAVSNAKIGNFIASSDFNGTIDGNGNITDNGTVGWAVAKGNGASGKAVFQNIVARGDIEVPAASIGSAKIAELAVGRLQIVGGAITFTSIVELENTWPSSAMGERQIGFVDFSAAAQDAALLKLYVQPTSPGSASVTQLGNSKLQISTDAVTWTTIGETASYQSPDPENPFLQPAGVVTTNGYPIRLAPVTYGAPTRGYWWGTGDRTRALLTELSVWPANNFGGTVTMQFVFLIPNAGTYRLYYCADDILSSGNFGTPQSGIVNLSYFAWSYTTPNVLTYTTNGPNQIATLNVTCTDTGGLEGFAAYFVNTATEIANSTEGALWTVRRPNYVTSVYKYARVLATRFDSSTNPNVNAWLGVEIIRK
jgi:hypothetical protein